jgi:hypothetical protein
VNCLVVEDTAAAMRHRLRVIEGGKPAGEIVSLVQPEKPKIAGYDAGGNWVNDVEAADRYHEAQRQRRAEVVSPAPKDPPESALFGAHVDYPRQAMNKARGEEFGPPMPPSVA